MKNTTMLRDIAVARVKMHLGFKTNLDAEIVQAMIEMQAQLERDKELPGFLRKSFAAFATVADVKTLAVPTDFIREYDGDQLFVTNDDGEESPVIKDLQGFLRLRWPTPTAEENSLPQRYALVARTYHFYPTPDAVYTLNGTYYAHDEVLSTNIENKWLLELPEILIARAGMLLGSGLRDKEGLTILATMDQIATKKLHEMTTAEDQAGTKPVMGGED